MRAFALLVLLSCGVSCGAAVSDPKGPVKSSAAQTTLAKDLDPGPIAPVWSSLDADVRRDLESGAPRSNKLEAARTRLERGKLSWDVEDDARLRVRLRALLEGLFLLEPIAFGPASPEKAEAETLLLRFWATARGFRSLARGIEVNGAGRGDAALDVPTLNKLFGLSERQGRSFASRVLQHGTFDGEDLKVFATSLEAGEDLARARPVWDEIVKREPAKMTARDWLSVSRISLADGDDKASDDALARAKSLSKPKSNDEADLVDARRLVAAVRDAERHRKKVDALKRRAVGTGVDAALAKADWAAELGRVREAKAQIEALEKTAPNDARVRLRVSQQVFSAFGDGVSIFDAATRAHQALERPQLTDENADFHSWALGLAGTQSMQVFATAGSQPDPKAFLRGKFPGILADLARANDGLAKYDPGRAAAVSFLLERTTHVVGASSPEKAVGPEVASALPAIRALVAKYPKTGDLYRVLYATAPVIPNEALAIVSVEPPVEEGDATLAIQRATVASLMAGLTTKAEWIELARKTAEAIPETDDDATEGLRAALRADAESLAASKANDIGRWRRATRLYEVAKERVKPAVRARVANDLGFALLKQGLAAEALAAFQESAQFQGERRWVPMINIAFLQAPDKIQRLAFIKQLETAFLEGKRDVPPFAHAWHVALTGDDAEKKEHAKAYVDALDESILRIPRSDIGNELEGNFTLRLGVTSSRGAHLLDVSFGAVLWLLETPPVTVDELAKIAKSAPPAKKAPESAQKKNVPRP